jgi:hypothetical protein
MGKQLKMHLIGMKSFSHKLVKNWVSCYEEGLGQKFDYPLVCQKVSKFISGVAIMPTHPMPRDLVVWDKGI